MRFFNFRAASAGLAACVLCFVALAQTGGGKGRGFDKARMDETVSACTDFYQYSNGNWLKTTEIPAAQSSWGSFNILAENNRKTLREILEESAKNTKARAGSNEQKVGDFYATCMDEAKREAEGAKPLAPYLARIDKVKDLKGLQAELAYFHRTGLPALFGFGAAPDFKNSSMQIGTVGQGGLSLPNKDYYSKTDEKSVKLRADFVQHLTNMFKLARRRPGRRREERADRDGHRDAPRRSLARPRRAARPDDAVPPDDAGRAGEAHAELLVGRLLRGPRPSEGLDDQRRAPRVLPGRRQGAGRGARRRLEDLPALAARQRRRGRALVEASRPRTSTSSARPSRAARSSTRSGAAARPRPTTTSARRWGRSTSRARSRPSRRRGCRR